MRRPRYVHRVRAVLTSNAIELYSCFISYSTEDQAFADRLYADLQAKGVRRWFAKHDVVGKRKIYEQIDEAVRLHEKLLLILARLQPLATSNAHYQDAFIKLLAGLQSKKAK